MAVKRHRGPGMDRSLADQMVWDFEDNRSDIAMVEKVLAMAQERIGVIPVFVVEGVLKFMECVSVDGEHVRRDSDEGANTRLAMNFARLAFDQKLALVPADSLASGSTDLKLLNMDMLVPVHMFRFVEPEFEDDIFASVSSQIQTEGIQTLNVEGVRRREDDIRIDGHRHHRGVGNALKQIQITQVQAWIFFRKFGIEMMRHRSPLARIWIFLEQARYQRRVNVRATTDDGLAVECEDHPVAVVEPHSVDRRGQRPELDHGFVVLHHNMLDVQLGAVRQDLSQLDESAGVVAPAAIVTRQRVRARHRPVDVVSDVDEKGGAIAGLKSLENLADAVGCHRVAPSICGVSRRAGCRLSPQDIAYRVPGVKKFCPTGSSITPPTLRNN